MRRIRTVVQSELWRHGLAGAVSAAVAVVILVQGDATFTPDAALPDRIARIMPAMFVMFGVYGPVYLVLTFVAFHGLRGDDLRAALTRSLGSSDLAYRWALGLNPGSWALSVSVVALAAVVTMFFSESLRGQLLLFGSAIACLVGSWILLLGVFACEYARAWARDDSVKFLGGEREWFDFVYFSGQVSTSFSPGDVVLEDTPVRRLVCSHGITAFSFSTMTIGLFVSVAIAQLS